jgi:glycosyltransferase involved in cell wall biosynthesis
MSKSIVIATNLNVWSISKGVGAASFYKTLEAYNGKGFDVYLYTSEKGLDIKELENVSVIRVPKLTVFKNKYLYAISRNFNYLLSQFLFVMMYLIKQKKSVDIFYAYEIEFVPALKVLSKLKGKPFVSRFQGTILAPLLKESLWRLKYFPHYLSIKIKSSLTVMTDDGTKGKEVISSIRGNSDDVLFIKNGVDISSHNQSNLIISSEVKKIINETSSFDYKFISVSRLQSWKRLDRSINVFQEVLKSLPNCHYVIVGEGEKTSELKKMVNEKGIADKVLFTGGLEKSDVNALMSNSDVFLSHYELSNVGNPLWEALSNDCIVVTINNGDTGKVIEDGISGIISPESDYMSNAAKIQRVLSNPSSMSEITMNGRKVLKSSVTTWDERMSIEVSQVTKLIKQ